MAASQRSDSQVIIQGKGWRRGIGRRIRSLRESGVVVKIIGILTEG